ncbi:MAG TPA: M23 family metallopeptidase, partial [Afifellaceae bacterium]|nr:M23 family metallopeptidase [Afifellaceae bacterium]
TLIFQHVHRAGRARVDLGDDEPLYIANIQNGPPDRRRVSMRWLAGAVLTGVFASTLIGGALQAAIGPNQPEVIRPALALARAATGIAAATGSKADRIRPQAESEVLQRVIPVSTVTRLDDRDLIKVRPFAHIRTALARPVEQAIADAVPPFDPLRVFSDGDSPVELVSSDSIYSAAVDGELAIRVSDIPAAGLAYDGDVALSDEEAEHAVRLAAPFLADGAVELASMPYADPARFDVASAEARYLPSLAVAIVPENVSFITKTDLPSAQDEIEEDIVTVAAGDSLTDLLMDRGATEAEARQIQSALVANFSFDFRAGQSLRMGLDQDEDGRVRPIRVSLYADQHLATVALADSGVYVAAAEPQLPEPQETAEVTASVRSTAGLSVYGGIWRAALSVGIPAPLVESMVRIVAFEVDLQRRTGPQDALEVVYSMDEDSEAAEILYASLAVGGTTNRFYRFRTPDDGVVDYYDSEGKSANKFLMRKPVASGRFRSAFGMRRHPILGRHRMHTGVDWSAPRGTPIMASGNGTVTHAGRKAGYGHHVEIRHANGYVTTYSHMSGYAKGVQVGTKVRQGQVIGYVGSTGLSTGPHLHYEVLVNKRFVDPMKIRLPRGRTLQGSELAAFERERRRIDALLERDGRTRTANTSSL